MTCLMSCEAWGGVQLLEHRRHDEEGEEQREADQDLTRRGLGGAQRLTQDGENYDDACK